MRFFLTLFVLLASLAVATLLIAAPAAETEAIYTVNVVTDPAPGSGCTVAHCPLREAVLAANASAGPDTIRFSLVQGSVITLTSSLPTISEDLTIDGSNVTGLAINADGNGRILEIDAGTDVTLRNLRLTGGAAGSEDGGAILNRGNLTVLESQLFGNSAYDGGAIYNSYQGTLTVRDSVFSDNVASHWGGAIYSDVSFLAERASFMNNSASATGGALFLNFGVTMRNSTLSGNSASDSGALYNQGGTADISDTTIANNSASGGVGGVHNWGTLNLTNSIIAGSTGDDCRITSGTMGSNDHNLIEDGTCAGGAMNFLTGDPLLGPARYNGGKSVTHALLAGSPALNSGGGCGSSDQRSVARPQGAGCDRGAYEVESGPLQTGATYTVTGNGDHVDGVCGVVDCTLREAIQAANGTGGHSRIHFSLPLSPTIFLEGSRLPVISSHMTLQAGTSGPQRITISAQRQSGVLEVGPAGKATISGLIIRDGEVVANGAAIYNSGQLTLQQCVLTENHTTSGGGAAIYNSLGTITMEACTVSNNHSADGGAGIRHNDGTLSIKESTFAGNIAGDGGGALTIYNGATVTLTQSALLSNEGYSGGALLLDESTAVITGTLMSNNKARLGGAIFAEALGSLTLSESALVGNTAIVPGAGQGHGGGLYVSASSMLVTVINTTFNGNTAEGMGGGARIAADADVQIYFVTMSENQATSGGAISNHSSSLQLDSVILANSVGSYDCSGTAPFSVATSIIESGLCGGNALEPQLAPVADYGGIATPAGNVPTQALLPGSPAIDQGNLLTCPATDGRGLPRPVQGDTAPGCDIGAYELQEPHPTATTFVVNSSEDRTDGVCGSSDCTLREAVTQANTSDDPVTVQFDLPPGSVIRLDGRFSLPPVEGTLTLLGEGAPRLVISGEGLNRIFSVQPGATLTMTEVTLRQGSAILGGAILNEGALVVSNASFLENEAQGDGGAIFNASGAQLDVSNSTFYGNVALTGYGGALYNVGQMQVAHSTLSHNQAAQLGGGLYSNGSPLELSYTVLANSVAGGDCVNQSGTYAQNVHNWVEDSGCGAGPDNSGDPQLASPPAQNGGNGPTMALQDGSPLLDAGATFCGALPDQRGVPRPAGAGCDIGAYEALSISVSDASMEEPDAGTADMVFTVSMEGGATPGEIRVDYSTVPGSAQAGSDYESTSGTLVIAAGTASQTFSVPIVGEVDVEPHEVFTVELSHPQNAVLGDGTGAGTILNEDEPGEIPPDATPTATPSPTATPTPTKTPGPPPGGNNQHRLHLPVIVRPGAR
jgi:CSLREA domain-containing protein